MPVDRAGLGMNEKATKKPRKNHEKITSKNVTSNEKSSEYTSGTSHFYCNTPPICIAVSLLLVGCKEREILSALLPFVSQYAAHLYCNTLPMLYRSAFGKILMVVSIILYDWTTGVPDNGNEWRKFRTVPRLYPLRPLFCTSFNRGGNRSGFRLPGAGGGSFPLYGGTFARSYSVSIVVTGMFPTNAKKTTQKTSFFLFPYRPPKLQGRRRNPNPNFLVQISSGGVHAKGWGPKNSVCPSKPREAKVFGGISRDFAGISRNCLKSLRKCLCSIFWSLSDAVSAMAPPVA